MSSSPSSEHPEAVHALPKVSVAMVTYNHEKFIAQAVESVMMQQTNFDYELVVGEDCSTDNTRRVLLELQNKYPDRLKLLLHEQNLGASKNFKQTLCVCHGQYLAILEGDDYWISPDKLQKQVDALEKNPDWSICTHRIIVFFEDGSQPSYLAPKFNPKPVSKLDDLSRTSFVGTSAAVYRKIPLNRYPEWIFQVEIVDYALSLFYARYGEIGFIDKVMCAYRKHTGALWSQRDSLSQRTALARDLRIVARHMGWQHRRSIESQAAQTLLKIVKTHLDDGRVCEARKVMRSIFCMAYCLPALPWRRFSRTVLNVYAPWAITILRSIKWLIVPPKPVGKV